MPLDVLEFGAKVHVSHLVAPIYLRLTTTQRVRQPAPGFGLGSFWLEEVEEECDPRLERADKNFVDPNDVGGGLPGSPKVPPTGTHRRLRRWPLDRTGVVIGRTWRGEGSYHPGFPYARSWDGDYDGEEPSFVEENRVWVYQIALKPLGGVRVWPADRALAVQEDLRVLS